MLELIKGNCDSNGPNQHWGGGRWKWEMKDGRRKMEGEVEVG